MIVGILAFSLSYSIQMEVYTRWMIAWDFLGLSYILLSIYTLFNTNARQIRGIAQKQDIGHSLLFIVLVGVSLASMIAIVLLIKTNKDWFLNKHWISAIYLGGVIVCWTLMHILFTFHYAHMYYGDDVGNRSRHRGGLNFPGTGEPDYLDFAYFSYVVGMTFQVSDVEISDRHIRRTVLVHGLIAFVFNTVVVALSINAIISEA